MITATHYRCAILHGNLDISPHIFTQQVSLSPDVSSARDSSSHTFSRTIPPVSRVSQPIACLFYYRLSVLSGSKLLHKALS